MSGTGTSFSAKRIQRASHALSGRTGPAVSKAGGRISLFNAGG